jgi:hypothetical protein
MASGASAIFSSCAGGRSAFMSNRAEFSQHGGNGRFLAGQGCLCEMKVCFLEAVLRDQRDGTIADLPIAETELHGRRYAEIEIEIVRPLRIVDLRDDSAVIMGVPSDVAKATSQTLARAWPVAFHEHPETPDGIEAVNAPTFQPDHSVGADQST